MQRLPEAATPTEDNSPEDNSPEDDDGNAWAIAGGIVVGVVYGTGALVGLLLLGTLLRLITGLPLRGSWRLRNESRSRA